MGHATDLIEELVLKNQRLKENISKRQEIIDDIKDDRDMNSYLGEGLHNISKEMGKILDPGYKFNE